MFVVGEDEVDDEGGNEVPKRRSDRKEETWNVFENDDCERSLTEYGLLF